MKLFHLKQFAIYGIQESMRLWPSSPPLLAVLMFQFFFSCEVKSQPKHPGCKKSSGPRIKMGSQGLYYSITVDGNKALIQAAKHQQIDTLMSYSLNCDY